MKFIVLFALTQLISFTSFAANRNTTFLGYEGKLDVLVPALFPIPSGDYRLEKMEVCGFFRSCQYSLLLKGTGEEYSLPLNRGDLSTLTYLKYDLPKETITITTLDQKMRLDVHYKKSFIKSFFQLVDIPQSCSRSCTGYEPNEVGTSICVSDRETCIPAQEACVEIETSDVKLEIIFNHLKTNQVVGTFVSAFESSVIAQKVPVKNCFPNHE